MVISSHNLAELEGSATPPPSSITAKWSAVEPMSELTSQASEIRFLLLDAPPLEQLKALPGVSDARFDAAKGQLAVRFAQEDGGREVIGHVLGMLDALVASAE